MRQDTVAALAAGATLVTATPRLARAWQQQFGAAQIAAGRQAWQTPTILPWAAFVRKLWNTNAKEGDPALLTAVQEESLWESIVGESAEAAELLQPGAAARLASQAWRLIHDWAIPLAGRRFSAAVWETTGETRAFQGWMQQFQFHTRWLDRIDEARLPELLLGSSAPPRGGPQVLLIASFDEFTPRQLSLMTALEKAGAQVVRMDSASTEAGVHGNAVLAGLADSATEMQACAEWCRQRLAAHPSARIGVIAADLEQRRHQFERAFRLTAPGAFHIALGPELSSRPMIAAALQLLEFSGEQVSWESVSSLMLSPWVTGFGEERGRRASCEVVLRRAHGAAFSAAGIARHGACPPMLSRALWAADNLRRTWDVDHKPGEWSKAFAALLDAFGWPGGELAAAGSVEFQTIEAWRGTLSDLASMDVTIPAVSRLRALHLLKTLARERRFEPESAGEPIQIMGMGEAAGAHFDYLWIAGMNDEVWPARPKPNPFIPLALHRQFNLPHASPARELEFASRVTRRLAQSAGDMVVSYAKADAERELAPSPLFAAFPSWRGGVELADPIPAQAAPFELIADSLGPIVPESAVTSGGTRTLEMQAKCPFRAFAEIRLGARELDTPEAGLDPRERGGFLHAALEHFWKKITSSEMLRAASPHDLNAAITASVEHALSTYRSGGDLMAEKLIGLERVRLVELVESWIEVEKQRELPFTVEAPEQERTVELGGLTVQVRLDRLDRLASGAYVLVDYKSRAPKLADWDGERPESPQLPIYAVTATEPLAAIAFAQIRTAGNSYKGYSTLEGALPGIKVSEPAELAERVEDWGRVLRSLGQDFRNGRANVDPKERFKTCEFCHLKAMCRVGGE